MSQKPYLIGIVGGSGSGKTSFLRDLLARLPDKTCAVVSQDNYYRAIDEQVRDANGTPNFDVPNAIHRQRFFDDLRALMRGETIIQTEYTYNHRDRPRPLITIEPADVLIVEGLFVFHYEQVRCLLDLRVFIDADEQICKQRRLQRDHDERGYPAEDVEYRWERHVVPAYRQFVLPYREEAHIIVINHASYEQGLETVLRHLQARLSEPEV